MADSTDGFDVIRCACLWRYDGAGDIVNVVDLHPNELVGSALDSDVLQGVAQWFNTVYHDTDYVTLMPLLIQHSDIAVYNLTDDYPVGHTGRLPVLDGEHVGEAMPSGVSPLLTFRTSVSRRLGRKYLPPIVTAAVLDGAWDTATMAILNSMATEFRTSQAVGEDFELQYVVRASASSASNVATGAIVRNVPAYQRRRKIGVGS